MRERQKRRIIFVDDDENVGQALRRMLRPMRNEWDMEFASSGGEALEKMELEPFDIVISDMHMPGMHGADFLGEVMDRYPETIRFALSGSPGGDTVIRTSSIVHQFLVKPFDPHLLMQLITRAFALRDQLEKSGIKALLLQMGGVPSVPTLYRQIVQEMQREKPSVEKVAAIIEKDAGMSAKVLQIVNSGTYGLKQHVSNVVQAAKLLGLSNIRNLVLAAEAFQPTENDNLPSNFQIDALWEHSLRVAAFAKKIMYMETEDLMRSDEAFTAGLLHDIGQIVLATNKSEEFGEALRRAQEEGELLIDAEKAIFGATHAEVGGYLLELWGLPDPITEAITFHFIPSGCSEDEFCIATALHAANYFAEDEDDDGVALTSSLDNVHLERIGLGHRVEEWYDSCQADEPLTLGG
jgi:HD-like signal output (HDOD) protein/CheY-like chemotaxis protein